MTQNQTQNQTQTQTINAAERLRRSCHFVPGANEKMLHKSIDSNADCLILDLEDAVTPANKDSAREVLSAWLGEVDFRGKERTVRINPMDSPWGARDLEVTMRHPPDAYVIPKVATAAEVAEINAQLAHWETTYDHPANSVALILICGESPMSVLNLPDLARSERVAALTWGAEDLATALGAQRNRDAQGAYLPVFEHCRSMTLLSATAAATAPIDTVYADFKDSAGLANDCQQAAWMGYTGKLTIHPAQIDLVNESFSPQAEDVATARRLVEAFADAERQGLMAISFEGSMVDVPHLRRAERLLARAAAIEATTPK